MSEPLEGKHALVTGGGRGIGAAIASALAADGARVTLLGRSRPELEAHANALGVWTGAQAVVADITDDAQVRAAFAEAQASFGRIDILVNNAGAAASRPFAKMDRAAWDAILDLNLGGTFACSLAAVPAMVEAGWGRIVNVASTAGLTGGKYLAAYCASKHGVIGLTRSLAIELATSGVTVNAVCPGFVATDMMSRTLDRVMRFSGRSQDEARDAVLAASLQTRVVAPEEVGATVAWLCRPEAGAVTGQAISIEASGTIV